MSDFVWIISAEKQSSLGNGGISASYIISSGQMNGLEGCLRGSRLWLVLRGHEDRCIAMATIKGVERFRDGYYVNDFLVSCKTTASFRLSSSFENAKPYLFSDFQYQAMGMHRVSEAAIDKLKKLVSKTVQVKLTAPRDSVLRHVKLDAFPEKGTGVAKAALSQIAQAFPLDQIWASGTTSRLGPFSNFASCLLSLHQYDASRFTSFFKANDPVSLFLEAVDNIAVPGVETSAQAIEKSIDLDFTEIDPEKIYARTFVPSEGLVLDLESALSKTEFAEKRHQDMLRDISSYLKGKGLSPYESSSVDLMVALNGETHIFEVKSSTPANIVAQAAKGAFQMACYANAMIADYQPLIASLILHKIEDNNLENFVHSALRYLGVKYLTYDPSKTWPNRVFGLL